MSEKADKPTSYVPYILYVVGIGALSVMGASVLYTNSYLSSKEDKVIKDKIISITGLSMLGAFLLGCATYLYYLQATSRPIYLQIFLTIACMVMSFLAISNTVTMNRS